MIKRRDIDEAQSVAERDPYAIHGFEQMLTLFDGGDFIKEFKGDHRKLLQKMQDHIEDFGQKSAKGSFTLTVSYELNGAGDLGMSASAAFKEPTKPASKAGAYVDENGQMTLYSPMMKRMHSGVRDVTPHDPETGEVRDV